MDWVDVLKIILGISQGLLTPVIALLAIYIAFQQYKTNHDKLRLDLYDRRYKVFQSVVSLLQHILGRKKLDDEQLYQFHAATIQGVFLFEQDVSDYLDEIFRNAAQLCFLEGTLTGLLPSPDREKFVKKKQELIKWFSEQFDISKDSFRRYLDFRAIGKKNQKVEKTVTQTVQPSQNSQTQAGGCQR